MVPETVDEYFAALPEDRREAMEAIRAAIREAAPDAAEGLYYHMPAFRSGGRFLVSYQEFKAHCSLFPASGMVVEALGDELAPYLSGKATLRFPTGTPIPAKLIRRVVEIRLRELEAGSGD